MALFGLVVGDEFLQNQFSEIDLSTAFRPADCRVVNYVARFCQLDNDSGT